jgi:signal transduction histidine kinase
MNTLVNDLRKKLARGVHFFYVLVEPRAQEEEMRRREFILNVFLLASIVLTTVLNVLVFYSAITYHTGYRGVPPACVMGILAAFIGLLVLSRRGWIRLAAIGLLVMYVIPLTFALTAWGADLPQGILGYGLIIVMSGILLGTRASFIATGLAGTALLLLTRWQLDGRISPALYWKDAPTDIPDVIAIIVTYGILTIVCWLANHEIEKSLHRARISEAALTVERDSLEHKVQERTRELQRLQTEQLAHLHPFAEFGRLASGFFHDLSAPLTAISLNLEQLAHTDAPVLEEGRGHVERAFSATKRLEAFLKAIRSQVQQREIATFFSPVEEIQQVLRVLEHRAMMEHVDLSFRLDSPPVRAYGNPFKFAKMITNLVLNALDACESLPPDAPRKVQIAFEVENGRMICRVTDTGIGVPKEHLSRVFEPFFTTKPPERGIGIGLSIVKEVTERDFQGTVSVASQEGDGSTFTLVLPLRSSEGDAR